MGEAKRRGSHPVNAALRLLRWMNRLWLLYPKPIRTFYRVNAEIFGVLAVALLVALILAVAAQWLMHR